MNHHAEMLRQPNIPHLSNGMLNAQHFPPGPSSQPHHMTMMQNPSNPNPALAMGSAQPPNPTPAQMYHQHHLNQQRRNPALPAGQNGQGLPASSVQAPHMNGIGPNQLQGMGYPNSMMAGGTAGVRRTMSQPGMNQPGLNQIVGMHPGQPGMGGMGGMGMNPQGIPHQNMRIPPQPMGRMQQQSNPQIQGQDMGLGMNARPQHMQGNQGMPGNPPRPQASQQSMVGNVPQSMGFHSSMPMPQQNPQMSPHSTPQSQTPGGPLQQPMNTGPQNRTPENSVYGPYPGNPQFPQGMHNPRLSGSGGQFGFSQTPDSSNQDLSAGVSNPNLPSGRGSLSLTNLTPAQQFEIQRSNGDYGHFLSSSMSHQQSHPSSQPPNMPHQTNQQQHQGGEHIGVGGSMPSLQRPQSQPQTHGGPTPRPPSQQAGPSRTPHMGQPQLPTVPPNRIPSVGVPNPQNPSVGGQPGPSQPPSMGVMPQQSQPSGQNLTNQPSPPFLNAQRPGNAGVPPSNPVSSGGLPESSGSQPTGVSYQQKMMMNLQGQGIIRLLQFSGALSSDNRNKLGLTFWENLVKDYFTPKAILKYTLWKDNQRNEAKPFEIGTPILPRFFLVTSQSGVHSMSISLDGAREKILGSSHLVVECLTAVWTYRYQNGYTIQLCGPLTAHLVLSPSMSIAQGAPPSFSMKFEHLQFDANVHNKLIQVDSISGQKIGRSPLIGTFTPGMNGMGSQPDRTQDRVHYERATIPGEPVNAFGIPQATMRCLELAESVAQMTDLIQFSGENNFGPLQSLKQFAEKIKDTPMVTTAHVRMAANNSVGPGFQKDGMMPTRSMTTNQAVTLIQPNNQQGSQPTPLNAPPPGDSSPSKQNKPAPTMPPQQQPQQPTRGASVTPASTPAATTSATTTPSLAAATLKRKAQNDTSSPTTDHAPPSKRPSRVNAP